METLRFLMVTTHYPPIHIGGDAVFVQNLATELMRIGHDVHVLTNPSVYHILRGVPPSVDRVDTDLAPAIHAFNPEMPRATMGSAHLFGLAGQAEAKLRELVRQVKPDFTHWHNARAFFGRIVSTPDATTIYTAHDYAAICPRSNLLRQGGRICPTPHMCQLCLIKCGKMPQPWRHGRGRLRLVPPDVKILCPSEFMARRLRSGGVEVHDIVHNFVSDPGGANLHRKATPRRITFAGILEEHKGPFILLDAFVQSRHDQGYELAIIGDGSLKNSIERYCDCQGVGDRVRVLGYLSNKEKEEVIGESEALVLPSQWPENAPMIALEALSLGVPVIGADIGGIPEIIASDCDSMLFDSADSSQLARRLVEAWHRMDGMLGINSRRAYEEKYSPRTHLSRYLHSIGD